VGRELYTAGEAKRETILDIFTANAKRSQEALRVLEEFTKLIKPKAGKLIKDLRFKVYDLEKKLYYALNRRLKLDFDIYVITDDRRDHVAAARQALAGGARIIQLRDKSSPKMKLVREAKQIGKIATKAGAVFIVNDYLDVAREADADGVHLGQEDLGKFPISRARKYLGEDKIIGVSVDSYARALKAEKMGADYLAVGPIFATPIKADTKPAGLKLLKQIVQHVKIPVVAIGGINESNLSRVAETGCQRVAVIRAVFDAKNVPKAVRKIRNKLLK
jgi:thiamine-phosphate pyrophosphorylase